MRQIFLLSLLIGLAASGPARAGQSYDNCSGFIDSVPATITTQGVWCLRADLSTAITAGNTITVAANNVTIDCNEFKLGGLGGGPSSLARGIYSQAVNTTVRNCNIRGFFRGIYLTDGSGYRVEANRLDGNLYYGMYVYGAGSMVRKNTVLATGGSTEGSDLAFAIYVGQGTDVIDNTILGVSAIGATTFTYGIYTFQNGSSSIRGNRIKGMVSSGAAGETHGIYNLFSGRTFIRDNDIHGPGPLNSLAIRCSNSDGSAGDNYIAGFGVGIEGCADFGNPTNFN